MRHFVQRHFAQSYLAQRHLHGRRIVLVDAMGGRHEIGGISTDALTADEKNFSADDALQLAVAIVTSGVLNWEL